MYVDDLISGGFSREEVLELKTTATQIFSAGGFKLNKFHSNCELEYEEANIKTSVESPEVIIKGNCNDTTYVKQQLGTQPSETKILGLLWDKKEDSFAIEIPSNKAKHTKRAILSKLASIYDPLGLISPVHPRGKVVYRELCELKLPYDKIIPNQVIKVWEKWESVLPSRIKVPRSIVSPDTPLNAIDIHVFDDSSIIGTCAAAYAVTHQSGHANQQLIASKPRLAKQNMSIPTLELLAVHMASNLAENIKSALSNYNIRDIHGWTDSIVVLHWLKGKRDYKQFVSNRINKITAKAYITGRHVPSNQNPADIGSTGAYGNQIPDLWWTGPTWLEQPEHWPPQPNIMARDESEKETKTVKTLLATSINIDHEEDECDRLLLKHNLSKFIRITCWISRFFPNCRQTKTKGPLTTEETNKQLKYWIHREQQKHKGCDKFKSDEQQLNFKINKESLYECQCRIEGHYPIYQPSKLLLSEKPIYQSHLKTIHGGVNLTMTHIRTDDWIPTMTQLTKKIINKCHGGKRFNTKPYPSSIQGQLPKY